MKFETTANFTKKTAKLFKKNPRYNTQFKKQFNLLRENHKHPGLKLHKLKGNRSNQFALWIEGNIRAICAKENDTLVFYDLITHDEY